MAWLIALAALALAVAVRAWRWSTPLHAGTTLAAPAPLWPTDERLSARVRRALSARLDSLDDDLALAARAPGRDDRRHALDRARRRYKSLEGVLFVFAPDVAHDLNGNEMEDGDDSPDGGRLVPRGFAALGEAGADAPGASDELRRMRARVAGARPLARTIRLGPPFALEIARLELGRVATVGITGGNAALRRDAMPECAAALDGVAWLVDSLPAAAALRVRLAEASAYLREHPAFDDLDRYTFVVQFARPAFVALAEAQRAWPPPSLALRRVWPDSVPFIYDAARFDAAAFAEPGTPASTSAWVALGEQLFADPALSGSGTRSCASCHRPELGYTDGLPRAASLLPSGGRVLRHTPRLSVAALQSAEFADARAASLERQIDSVLVSPGEMGGSMERAVTHVRRTPALAKLAARATGQRADSSVSAWTVRTALALYVRSLTRFDTPFDHAMRGDGPALSPRAQAGFNLFMGRAGCGTCHFAPLFNGTMPPDFVTTAIEVIGVPAAAGVERVDPDSGRGTIDRLPGHVHAFKTPTVRDAALGGPYMHNGSLHSLREVLDFYDVARGARRRLPNRTLPDEPLHLDAGDRLALESFLRSLSVMRAGRSAG